MARKQDPELAELARERGFEVHAGLSNADLHRLLGDTSPSDAQIAYAQALAGQQVPLKSYAHARKVIGDLEDLLNSQALNECNWNDGDVLAWRDGYYLIDKIHGAALHRFSLRPVELEPDGGLVHVVVSMKTKLEVHNPVTLRREGARKVRLDTWPISLEEPPDHPSV